MDQLVLDLTNPVTRENALLELSKKRESFPELAPYLWHSFGTISALLQARSCCKFGLQFVQSCAAPGSLRSLYARHVGACVNLLRALPQEIVSIYPLLSPPSLTAHASNRVCNALALLQCVASHPETRSLFLQGANFGVALSSFLPQAACSNSDLTMMTLRSARATFPLSLLEHNQQDAAF